MKSDAFGSPLPQAAEWQRVGNQIYAAIIFARAESRNVVL
jgi:hypothetical protein